MSGITGIYFFDERSAGAETLARMVDSLAHRGADGAGIWREGAVGLGHRMLWVTPESLHEKLPLVSRGGNLVLTADARIDNRDELIAALGMRGNPRETITDSELIVAAYEKWGDSCPEKLLGDFAFAIWNRYDRQLFCARDPMGVKPFYYYCQPDKFFAFGSEIKALFCLEDVPRQVNDAKLGVFLCQLTGFAALKTETFYRNIFRLPPAHWMTVSPQGCRLKPYWDLEGEAAKIKLNSEREYIEAFQERFTQAVVCRLRSAYPVASNLSGGLDSSSVSCVARIFLKQQGNGADLITIYGDGGLESTDEKSYVRAVLAGGGFQHCFTKIDRNVISAAQTAISWINQPLQMPTPVILLAAVQAAQQQGARVMLTGHDGDTIVSHGRHYLAELVELENWQDLTEVILAYLKVYQVEEREFQTKLNSKIFQHVVPYLKHQVSQGSYSKFLKSFAEIARHSHWGLWQNLRVLKHSLISPKVRWQHYNPAVSAALAKKINLQELIGQEYDYMFAEYVPSQYREHSRGILSDNLLNSTEEVDGICSGLSVEPRHPFLDQRVIELCLAAPANLKFYNGRGRGVMRCAMMDILPPEVRERTSKIDFSEVIVKGLEKEEPKLLEDLLFNRESALGNYVSRKVLSKQYQEFLNPQTEGSRKKRLSRLLAKTAELAIWLDVL